jgi:membrane associated rhomboid family serine protease
LTHDYLVRLKRFIYRDFDPVTKSVMLGAGLVYVLGLLTSGLQLPNLKGLLLLSPVQVLIFPWTVLTYPLVNLDLLSLVFAVFWLWFIGGSLERSWGSKRYGWFCLLTSGVTGLSLAAIGLVFKVPFQVYGLWLPIVGITWAWAALSPDQELLLWGLVPIRAKWLAWMEVLLTFLTYFNISHNLLINLLFGLAAISGVTVAYFYRGSNSNGGSGRGYREAAARRARRSRFRVIK